MPTIEEYSVVLVLLVLVGKYIRNVVRGQDLSLQERTALIQAVKLYEQQNAEWESQKTEYENTLQAYKEECRQMKEKFQFEIKELQEEILKLEIRLVMLTTEKEQENE